MMLSTRTIPIVRMANLINYVVAVKFYGLVVLTSLQLLAQTTKEKIFFYPAFFLTFVFRGSVFVIH